MYMIVMPVLVSVACYLFYKMGIERVNKGTVSTADVVGSIKSQLFEMPIVKFGSQKENKTEFEDGYLQCVENISKILERQVKAEEL
jgi:hypothetical protein